MAAFSSGKLCVFAVKSLALFLITSHGLTRRPFVKQFLKNVTMGSRKWHEVQVNTEAEPLNVTFTVKDHLADEEHHLHVCMVQQDGEKMD